MTTTLERAPRSVVSRFEEAFSVEMVGRNCRLAPYTKIAVPSFSVGSDFLAYCSPDSTFAATHRLLEAARESILIGIYDFTAVYIKELLLRALRRGVRVSLMLDLDDRTGETRVFNELVRHGVEGVPAPSCASKHARHFSSSHEKVIVIDDNWSLVQSGNWSDASIPLNEVDGGDPADFDHGNRDMGLAVRSKPLARFLSSVLRSDMRLELDATPEALERLAPEGIALEAFGSRPTEPPPELFPSKNFNPDSPVRVTPILSPDNYLDVIPGVLAAARRSIYIEQQYIRSSQPNIKTLLDAISRARTANPDLDVRIIVAPSYAREDHPKVKQMVADLRRRGLKLDQNLRFLSGKHFVHCHNKLLIVDQERVLVSSQNWSDSAVAKNREVGLLVNYPQLAKHFARIFTLDWETGLRRLPTPRAAPEIFGPESLATGRTLRLNWGDYAEV
jgi:phosphatidylserine/phosphatidylglycerophosphate/cardiolipin synthase-like enzyme